MCYEKKKLLARRLILLILLVIGIIIPLVIYNLPSSYAELLNDRGNIKYYGSDIVVYSGWYHRYIKVDGEKYDEQNTITKWFRFFWLVPIYLDCELDDGTYISAKITAFNRISLKINGRLYKEELNGYDGKDNYDRV